MPHDIRDKAFDAWWNTMFPKEPKDDNPFYIKVRAAFTAGWNARKLRDYAPNDAAERREHDRFVRGVPGHPDNDMGM